MNESAEKKKWNSDFRAGLKAGIPIVLGYIPAAIAYALSAKEAGLSLGETSLMSMMVYAGASQMIACQMIAQSAGLIGIVLSVFLLNLRHLIMSACLSLKVQASSLARRLLLAFGVTDEVFGLLSSQNGQLSSGYFFGAALASYLSWVLGSIAGYLAASLLPPILSASFSIALYAMFIALLMPAVKGNFRLLILVLFTCVLNALFGAFLPSGWALILSAVLAAAIGSRFISLDESDNPTANDQAAREPENFSEEMSESLQIMADPACPDEIRDEKPLPVFGSSSIREKDINRKEVRS